MSSSQRWVADPTNHCSWAPVPSHPPTLPHYSSKEEMQRVIIIRQGQITGLGWGWRHSIKGRFLGNQGRCREAGGSGGLQWVGVGNCRPGLSPCTVSSRDLGNPGSRGAGKANPKPRHTHKFSFQSSHTVKRRLMARCHFLYSTLNGANLIIFSKSLSFASIELKFILKNEDNTTCSWMLVF